MRNTTSTPLSTDQIISLLDIYESEWQHRNTLLWSQVFKLFYFSIFIIALPLISGGMGFSIPNGLIVLFPIAGIMAAFFSLYMAISYALRLSVTRDSINKLLNHLPPNYRIKKLITIKHGKYFLRRHTIIIPFVLFVVEVLLAIVMIYCIGKGLLQPPIVSTT